MRKILFIVFVTMFLYGTCYARDVQFELLIQKDKVTSGRQVSLEMIFKGVGGVPTPAIPFIAGLDIRYLGIEKNPIEKTVTFRYRVVALRPGIYKIGPVSFEHKGNRYTSNLVDLTVEKEISISKAGYMRKQREIDVSEHIYLVLNVSKSTAYVNEKVPISIRLYTDWLDLENITFWEPSSEYLITQKFGDCTVDIIKKNGVKFAVLEYKSWIIPVMQGKFTLEPIKVQVSVARSRIKPGSDAIDLLNDNEAFYNEFIGIGDSRVFKLQTAPFDIVVLSLPRRGQPKSFDGAVGNFKFDLDVSRAPVKVGDRVRLKMTVSGSGNFGTVSVPRLPKNEGFEIYPPKTTKEENLVIYEQDLKVKSPSLESIPAISFGFFNPDLEKYHTVKQGPVAIKIMGKKADEKKTIEADKPKVAKHDIVGLKKSPGRLRRHNLYFYKGKMFIIFELFPLIFILVGIVTYRRRKRFEDDPDYAALVASSNKARLGIVKAERLLRDGNAKDFYALSFRITQEYLGRRLFMPSGGVTGKITKKLEESDINDEIINKIKQVFSDFYLAKYTTNTSQKKEMSDTLKRLKEIIDELDKRNKL